MCLLNLEKIVDIFREAHRFQPQIHAFITDEYSFTVGETAKIVTFSQELTCEITETKPRKA